MSQTVITEAFEQWKAQQATDNQPVILDEFVLANVPGLDPSKPIDRKESLPPAAHIVYRQAVSKTGVVNDNAVVYSVTMGADVGDFDFNWIGLVSKATSTVAMIVHAPVQSKVKNANGQQGNVLTRSFLMEYSGAVSQTLINTPAASWQIDFTARLAGMDEALRLANLDTYGTGAFFDTGFLVAKTGSQHFVTQGVGYIGGLRAVLVENTNVAVAPVSTKIWADVSYSGTLTSAFQTDITFTVAPALANYVKNGVAHYVFALASIDASGAITDLRPKGSSLYLRKDNNLKEIADPAAALNALNGVPKTRKVNNKDLSADITLNPNDVGALPSGGTAVAATKLATARKIAGVDFDGTKDINLTPGDVGALPSGGTAVAATKLATARKIAGVDFDGTKNIAITSGDVGALPITGGTLTGPLEVNSSVRAGSISIGSPAQGAFATHHGINIGDSDSGLISTADGSVSFFANGVNKGYWDYTALRYEGDITAAGSMSSTGDIHSDRNIHNTGIIQAGAGVYDTPNVRVYSPNNKPHPKDIGAIQKDTCDVAGFASGDTGQPYMRKEGSNEVVRLARWDWVDEFFATKVSVSNDIAAVRRWANGDLRNEIINWGTASFVNSIARGAQSSMVMDGGLVEAPAGCVLTGGNGNEGNQIGYALYRPLQMRRNSTWLTIEG